MNIFRLLPVYLKANKAINFSFGIIACFFALLTASQAREFSTDVIGINETHLSANFWLNKLNNGSALLMKPAEIASFNSQLIRDNAHISSPLLMPELISDVELKRKINLISRVFSAPRFYASGEQVTDAAYAGYIANANYETIQSKNKVLFALVVKRTGLRRFPTADKVYKQSSDKLKEHSLTQALEIDLDLFQESALFPGDAVAVLHTSKDGQWYLVQAYNYLAWLPKIDVAIGNKAEISAFKHDENYLVVTGSKVFTHYLPDYIENNRQLSQVQLDMGIRLPLAKRSDYGDDLYGQNPYTSYVVKLPIKNVQGKLQFALVAIARSQDVHLGYLPFSQHNLIQQSFKFLGERYGWGHDYNGRDCTGFIDEVYKSFGFIMPRNSGQQAKGSYGRNYLFNENSDPSEKLTAIAKLQVGDLIYIPGHVMMYLGEDKGKPYIIHDVKDLSYYHENDELYEGTLNGVSITPLLPLRDYVNNITNIKRIVSK